MKIYQDVFSGEEIISDSYKMEEVFGGAGVEVKGRYVVKGEENIDIGCGNAFGATNEDEEGGPAGGNPNVPKVLDLIDVFHYEETSFDKAGFSAYFKTYMKKVLEYLTANCPGRVDPFKNGARQMFKYIGDRFDEFTFYTPPSYDMDNIIPMSYYKKEDDDAPTFLFVLDGLKFYKV